jgi:hypothetical protein
MLMVDVDGDNLPDALIAAQQLDPADRDNPAAIKEALARVIDLFVTDNTYR